MVGSRGFGQMRGWGSNWDGAVDLSSGVYEREISAACLWANSGPFLSHRAEEEGEAGICCLCRTHSSYKQPLCPLALAKLLALLLLATACSACTASWPCLSWMIPAKEQGSSLVHQFTSCFASFTDWDRLWWCLLQFSCACMHILYMSNILTRLIANITNDKCPEIFHCSQITPSS